METLASASDDIVWEAGQKATSKKDWESARQYYRRLIDAFPQSPHQPGARIALADSYFEEGGTGNYVLAVSSYREFLTLYPQHARSDYAQFRAAESYFKQKNSPDRDQTSTGQALEEYERLLDVYPQSPLVEETRDAHPRVPPDARPLALPGRLLLPEDATLLALGHRPLRDDPLAIPRLRAHRRGAVSPRPGAFVRRTLRGSAAPAGPAPQRVPGEPLRCRGRQARSHLSALGARCSAGRSRDHSRSCHAASFSRSTSSVTLRIRANTP